MSQTPAQTTTRRPPVNLTQRYVDRLTTPEGDKAEDWHMDITVRGLGVRVRASGHKTYVLRYYNDRGQHRKHLIGDAAKIKLDLARDIARQRLGSVATGNDPNRERAEKRDGRKRDRTVSELGEETLQKMRDQGRSATYVYDNAIYLSKYINPAIGNIIASEVEPRQIEQLIRKLKDKPTTANRVRSLVKRMFSLARRWGYRLDDPTMGVEPYSEEARTRVLTDDEVGRLCEAMDASRERQSRNAALMVLLSGSRPKEVFSARWSDIDLETGRWTKPSQAVKQRREHTVYLSSEAVEVLREQRRLHNAAGGSPFVFPSERSASGHLTTIRTFWTSVVTGKAGIEDVTPYDLRRTFTTRLMERGADLATVMQATGHTTVAILMRHYAKAVEGKQRAAVEGLFGYPDHHEARPVRA